MKPFTTLDTTADELVKCNRCGFCLQTCPTYRATGLEVASARGRNVLARHVVEGRLELDGDLQQPFTECLLCGACTVACLNSVETAELMAATRQALHEKMGRPAVQRAIFRNLLPYPDRMRRHVRLMALGKRTGLSALARKLGLLGLISPLLQTAEGLVETMPTRFLTDRLPRLLQSQPEKPRARVLYFVSCGMNFQLPDAAEATWRVLQATGCHVEVVRNNCCGQPAYAYGDKPATRALARQNVDLYAQAPQHDFVVTDCGSCSSMLSHYGELLAADDEYAEQAAQFASKVRDVNALLAELGLPELVPTEPTTATYHDPCHMSRYQDLTAQPRELLQAVPDLEYQELPEADWCCGGGGSYNIAHHELSMRVLERKMANVGRTGAAELVTSCPACIIQLAYGVRQHEMPVRVRHISEVLAEHLAAL